MKSNQSTTLVSRVSGLATLGCLILGLTGCAGGKSSGTKPPKTGPGYSYIVRLDGSLSGQSFQVDVVPLNSHNREQITSMSVDDYFNDKNGVRTSTRRLVEGVLSGDKSLTLNLEGKNKDTQSIRYPAYSHIAVIADSSVRVAGAKGDSRRVLLPLDPNLWARDWPAKKRQITVTFGAAGGVPEPAPVLP